MDLANLHRMLDAVLDGVIVVDGSGRISLVNAEACRILETSAEQAVGEDFGVAFGARHAVARLAKQVRDEHRAAISDDIAIERRFEPNLVVDVAISPVELTGADGEDDDGLVIALRDHTLQSTLRERQAQRDQLQRFGHIAAGIAHEVKNPLGGIRGAAELLHSWSEDSRSRGAAEVIVREVDRISALVDQLMVFARGDELNLADVNIHRVLDDVLQLLGMDPLSSGVQVERMYDPSIPDLRCDADRLTQVFLNLARNAMQAMEESGGGAISVMTRMALDERLSLGDGRPVPTVLITVSDTGPGIPGDILARLATPFFTTRSSGTGLGLAMARHWVARHDGSMRITSQLGEGTTVRVSLPLEGPASAVDRRDS